MAGNTKLIAVSSMALLATVKKRFNAHKKTPPSKRGQNQINLMKNTSNI